MIDEPNPDNDALSVLTPEELEQIPPEVRPKVAVLRAQRFEMINSPLLPPELLARYDNVVPGLSEKLVKWTEQESEHRRALERESMNDARVYRQRGQLLGFTVSLLGLLLAGVILATTDSVPSALGAGIVAIVAVGGPFAARILASRWGRPGSPDTTGSE